MELIKQSDYDRIISRRNKIRYFALFVYVLISTLVVTIPFFISLDEQTNAIFILIVLLLATAFLLIVLFYPYKKKVYGMTTHEMDLPLGRDEYAKEEKDNAELNDEIQKTSYPYYSEIKLRILYFIITPILILYVFIIPFLYYSEGFSSAIIGVVTGIFFVAILAMFDRIKINIKNNQLKLSIGPFKDKINIDEIDKMSVVCIRAVRDYLGYGKRLGPDGAIGYIAQSGPGIKLWTDAGKIFVVNHSNPNELIRYLKNRN